MTNNVIFWDTEFSSLDPYKGELLSIGMVKPGGEELYLELEFSGEADPWVKENVLPLLSGRKVSRKKAMEEITAFLGENKPHLVAYVNQFDVIYLYKLLGAKTTTKEYPFHWIHFDFATMLAMLGKDPEAMTHKNLPAFAASLGIQANTGGSHHALNDARLLKRVYETLVK